MSELAQADGRPLAKSLKRIAFVVAILIAAYWVSLPASLPSDMERDELNLVYLIQTDANAVDLMVCIDSVRANGLGLQQGKGGPRTFKAQLMAGGPLYDAMSFTNNVRKTRLDVIEVGNLVVLKYYSKPGRNPREGEIRHLRECVGPNARWDAGGQT